MKPIWAKSCQGGPEGKKSVSYCGERKNKFQNFSGLPHAICYSEIRE